MKRRLSEAGFPTAMSFKRSERKMSTTLQLEDIQVLRRGSVANNMDPLEELVSCPIHLDILENPRLLPCGHAFCLECLDQCLQSMKPDENFVCPICRSECSAPERADGWPVAFTHGHIVDYVNNQKCKNYSRGVKSDSTPTHSAVSLHGTKNFQRRGSIIHKADMLKTLANDLASKGNSAIPTDKNLVIDELNKLLTKLTSEQSDSFSNMVDLKVKPHSSQCNPNGRRSSYTVQCMVEAIRQNMRKRCQYAVRKENCQAIPMRQKGSIELFPWQPCSKYTPLVDNFITDTVSIRVFVDDFGATYIHYLKENRGTNFNAVVGEGMFYPTYVRIVSDCVLISGLMTKSDNNSKVGIVAKFSHEGKLVAKSREYAMTDDSSPAVFGFDLDYESGEIIVAKPCHNEILILDASLAETDQYWVFDQPLFHPYYVCRNKVEGEIWATCPQQKTIMILKEEDGSYSHFGADKIFGACPSHIICTADERVLFLDDSHQRVFWIKKSFEYLCTQRVSLSSNMKGIPMRILQPINSHKFLIASDKEVFYAKPLKTVTSSSKCAIL